MKKSLPNQVLFTEFSKELEDTNPKPQTIETLNKVAVSFSPFFYTSYVYRCILTLPLVQAI